MTINVHAHRRALLSGGLTEMLARASVTNALLARSERPQVTTLERMRTSNSTPRQDKALRRATELRSQSAAI